MDLLTCPKCRSIPVLEDHRLVWVVRCGCGSCIFGERATEPHGDGVSSDEAQDEQARIMSENTDWDHYRNSAVVAWNNHCLGVFEG